MTSEDVDFLKITLTNTNSLMYLLVCDMLVILTPVISFEGILVSARIIGQSKRYLSLMSVSPNLLRLTFRLTLPP